MIKKLNKFIIGIVASTLLMNSVNVDFTINAQTDSLDPGEVTQSKSAKWSDYEKGIAEISFDVIGKNAEEPIDVAIVYDNSGSMQMSKTNEHTTTGWYYASAAAKTLTNELMKNRDNKVALIPFSDVLIDGQSLHQNPSDFFETHDYIYDESGNPDNAKMKAVYMTHESVERGYMTLEEFYDYCETEFNISRDEFVEKNNVTNALIPLTNNKADINNAIDGLYPAYAGTTNYEIALKEAQKTLSTSTAKQKIIVMISDGRPDKGKNGLAIAEQIKQSGITIYTCGSGLTNTDAYYLQQIASEDNNKPLYVGVEPEDLTKALLEMRKQFDAAAHNAIIEDTINTDYFEYYSDETHQPTVNNITLDEENFTVSHDKSSITWNIGDITENKKTLKFYIKVKDSLLNEDLLNSDSSFLNQSGTYLTNKDANLTYTDINTGETVSTGHEMPSPSLDVKTATLTTVLYESDKNGQILIENGEKVILKSNVSPNKALGISYDIIPESTITIDGVIYKLLAQDNQEQKVTFSENTISKTVNFRYVKVPSVTFDTTTSGKFTDDSTSKKIQANPDSMTIPELPSVNVNQSNMYFTGWNTARDGSGTSFTSTTEVTGDITVYAQYAHYPVNVSFVDEDGTIYSKQEVAYGKDAVAPTDPTKDGYTFRGWDVDFKNVTTDLIVTAVWEKNTSSLPIIPEEPTIPPTDPEQPIIPTPIVPTPIVPTPIVPTPIVPTPIVPAPIVPNPTIPVTPQPTAPVVTTVPQPAPATQTTVTTPQDNTVIEENNVPLGNGDNEEIADNETPLAGETLKSEDAWALINLICAIVTILLSLLALLLKHKKEEEQNKDNAYEDQQSTLYKRRRWSKVASAIIAIASVVLFILTEDMSLPMIFIDEWTLLMVAIAIVQLVCYFVSASRKKDVEEDPKYAQN